MTTRPSHDTRRNQEGNIRTMEAAGSNSLPHLAARIRAEHEATSAALKTSVEHAMAAGELLLEAKELVKHGQWLPWLAEHCAISDRTAQLYMRCAKNRSAIEANTQCVADLTLNEAAAILMLSSDVRKLLAFAKRAANSDPDELIELCAVEGIAVLRGSAFGAAPFYELEERKKLEWLLWVLNYAKKGGLAEAGNYYADHLQTRGWTLDEWYGDEGDRYRRVSFLGRHEIPQSAKDEWHAFLESNRDRTVADVEAEIIKLHKEDLERPKSTPSRRRRRHRVMATTIGEPKACPINPQSRTRN
jgi:hypothetical protein